jgi:hypothetical protein
LNCQGVTIEIVEGLGNLTFVALTLNPSPKQGEGL